MPLVRPVDINTLSEIELNEELEKEYVDMPDRSLGARSVVLFVA